MTERGHGKQRNTNKRMSNMTGRRGGNNNAIINVTGWGKGDAREAELQDRKVTHVWINTGPEGDTTRRERERVSKQQEGAREESTAAINARGWGKGEGRHEYVCVHKARATKQRAHARINSKRRCDTKRKICPTCTNSSRKRDNQQTLGNACNCSVCVMLC